MASAFRRGAPGARPGSPPQYHRQPRARQDRHTLSYPDGAAQATENVAALWRADLADASAFLRGRFDPRAWGDASFGGSSTPAVCQSRNPPAACASAQAT